MLLHIITRVLGLAFCAILQFKEQLHLEFFSCWQSTLKFSTGLPNDTSDFRIVGDLKKCERQLDKDLEN
jgi:hypothetical protein